MDIDLNHSHEGLDKIKEGILKLKSICNVFEVFSSSLFPQPPSLTKREEEAAFDSKSSSGLKVSHRLLSAGSVVHQLVFRPWTSDVQVL